MNPKLKLYTTHVIYTLSELKKLAWVSLRKQFPKWINRYTIAAMSLCLIFLSFQYTIYIYVSLFLIVSFLTIFLLYNRTLNRQFESNVLMKDKRIDYEFFNEYFRVITVNSTSTVQYSEIYEIIETPTNIYLLISTHESFVLIKENCSNDLILFIKLKVGEA